MCDFKNQTLVILSSHWCITQSHMHGYQQASSRSTASRDNAKRSLYHAFQKETERESTVERCKYQTQNNSHFVLLPRTFHKYWPIYQGFIIISALFYILWYIIIQCTVYNYIYTIVHSFIYYYILLHACDSQEVGTQLSTQATVNWVTN